MQIFSQNREKTDRPTSQGNVLCGASQKLLGWCCWSCEENKSHEYQHNIKRDWWLLPPDGKGLNLPHSPIRLCDIPHWLLSPFYTVFATTDPLSVPIANIVICKIPLLPLAIERWGGGCGFLVPKGVHLLLYSQKPGNVSWDNKHSITVLWLFPY